MRHGLTWHGADPDCGGLPSSRIRVPSVGATLATMGLRIDTVTVDARDPEALARWWAELLGSTAERDEADWVVEADGVTLLFGADDGDKVVKNRLHLDLRPDDRDAEVARAETLGATRVDIGQGEHSWVVLADPEGNEFCILRSHPD